MAYIVSQPKFDEMERSISSNSVSNGLLAGIHRFNNKTYAITGAIYHGKSDDHKLLAHRVILRRHYKGKTFTHADKTILLRNSNRENFYEGVVCSHGSLLYVLTCPQVEFISNNSEVQKSLF